MNILSEIKNVFKIDNIDVSERASILELSFNLTSDIIPNEDTFNFLFSLIPERDVIEITLDFDSGDNLRILRRAPFPNQEYNELVSDIDDEFTIVAQIEIKKMIENDTFSIYSFKSFSSDLLSLGTQGIMSSFARLLKGRNHLIFEIFEGNYFFTTETMMFVSEHSSIFSDKFARLYRLESCNDASNFFNKSTYDLLPDDFLIKIDFENNPLSKVFEQISSILSLAYISTSAALEDGALSVQIVGQRNVEYKYQFSSTDINKEFYKIYNWIYTDGSPVDKSLIARNIISLHCRYSALSEIDEKTFSSIQSNYKIYLKTNVSQYIELKNKLAEFICDVVSKTGDYATLLLSNLKTNLFAIFGFLFTVMLANIVSDQPLENIFTKDITVILEVVLVGSFVYLIICNTEARYKLKKAEDSYKYLKNNYVSVLSELDLQEIFDNDKILNKTVQSVKRGIWIYTIIWIIFLLIALVVLENVSSAPVIISWLSRFKNISVT